ncbi:MAG: hypothetical protein HY321_06160 [Armatimonadetes bacterium]|nr:hypothetical protein [Armatimonadota bacterium]
MCDPELTLSSSTTSAARYQIEERIYRIDDPVTGAQVRQGPPGWSTVPGSANQVWDGEDNSEQPVPKGIYTYTITDVAADKGAFLSVGQVTQELIEYDASTKEATVRVHYTLTDIDEINAASCTVKAIDPDLTTRTSVSAPTVVGSAQYVDVEVTLDKAGTWYFLVCPVNDGSTRRDGPRPGRRRSALTLTPTGGTAILARGMERRSPLPRGGCHRRRRAGPRSGPGAVTIPPTTPGGAGIGIH